jgi:YegS/Rv2252/BmrU family lipid kinase
LKCVFIVNPAAGKSDPFERYGAAIKAACEKHELPYLVRKTAGRGHATELAASFAALATEEEPVRIFSVGGDGTLSEVLRGMFGKPHCELGCIPAGSGNDYIKSHGKAEAFLDLEHYITAPSVPVDVIKAGEQLSLNICSLGLDAMICDKANRIKGKHKRLSGAAAYNLAVFNCLLGKLYNSLRVTIDDKEVFTGKFIFSIAANGQVYGSGYRAAPKANPSDGLLDFILIKKVSHLRVPSLVGQYKNGEHWNSPAFSKILIKRQGKRMKVESKKPVILNVDGECAPVTEVAMELLPTAVLFVVPGQRQAEASGKQKLHAINIL